MAYNGPLTWRDVAAPDAYGAVAALKLGNTELNQGLGGLSDALGAFHKTNQDATAAAAANAALNYSDPASLRAALANGSVFQGLDRNLLTPDAIKGLNGQASDLLREATGQQALDYAKQADPLRVKGLDLSNQNTALTNDRLAKLTPLEVAHSGLLNRQLQLEGDRYGALTPGTITQQQQAIAGQQTSNQSAALTLEQAKRGDADAQAAVPFLNKIATGTQSQDDINTILGSPEFKALSPGAQQKVIAAHGGGGAGTGASRAIAGAVGGGSAPGTAGTHAGAPEDTLWKYAPTTIPISTSKVKDVLLLQDKMIADPTLGASSAGAFQINRDTIKQYGPKALGPDWENSTFDLNAQRKIAQQIFEENKNGNLKAQWSSLPDATPGAYKNKTWAEMEPLIMKGEVGQTVVDPAGKGIATELTSLQSKVAAANSIAAKSSAEIGARVGQDQANNLSTKYATTQSDNRSTPEVIAGLKKAGLFTDIQDGALTDAINHITGLPETKGHITPATAAEILKSHTEGKNFLRYHWDAMWGRGNSTIQPDQAAMETEAKSVAGGVPFEVSQNSATAQAVGAKIETARAGYQSAAQDYAAAIKDPTKKDLVPGLRTKLNVAEQVFTDAISKQKGNDGLAPDFNKPTGGEAAAKTTPAAKDIAAAVTPTSGAPALAKPGTGSPTAATPAAAVIQQAADPSADPAIAANKAKVDALYAQLDAAQKANSPQRDAIQSQAEAADKELTGLIEGFKKRSAATAPATTASQALSDAVAPAGSNATPAQATPAQTARAAQDSRVQSILDQYARERATPSAPAATPVSQQITQDQAKLAATNLATVQQSYDQAVAALNDAKKSGDSTLAQRAAVRQLAAQLQTAKINTNLLAATAR